MKQIQYQELQDFFKTYTRGFAEQANDPEPFQLKIAHTANVCENMAILAKSQKWTGERQYRALACALLHDIGRFHQYRKYETFSDAQSENHALLSVKVIKKQGLLKHLEKIERQQITTAVALHNVFALPPALHPEIRELTELLRDADKLDIFRVMVELYNGTVPGRTSFITHHLPDDGQISSKLITNIENRQLIDLRDVKTLNAMKLLQVSWIFDLNFPVSLELVRQRGYIESILSTMPQSPSLKNVSRAVADFFKTAADASLS